jgi:hypothetical protein
MRGTIRKYLSQQRAQRVLEYFFGTGDFLGHFRGGAGMAASSSEEDKPESNKSSAWAEAWVASLPPAEVEDGFPQQSLRSRKKLSG